MSLTNRRYLFQCTACDNTHEGSYVDIDCPICGDSCRTIQRYGLCSCGEEIEFSRFTNTCSCGADYNSSGQLLAPRSQWGEETGEDLSDILMIE